MAGKNTHSKTPRRYVDPQTNSKFMALPAELLNEIYEFAFEGVERSIGNPKYNRKTCRPPGVLVACKMIYAGARQIYYTKCDFKTNKIGHLLRWLGLIDTVSRKSMRRLAFEPAFGQKMWPSRVSPEQVLCRVDHVLQEKDVTMELGAMRVFVRDRWWCWGLNEQGKKLAVRC